MDGDTCSTVSITTLGLLVAARRFDFSNPLEGVGEDNGPAVSLCRCVGANVELLQLHFERESAGGFRVLVVFVEIGVRQVPPVRASICCVENVETIMEDQVLTSSMRSSTGLLLQNRFHCCTERCSEQLCLVPTAFIYRIEQLCFPRDSSLLAHVQRLLMSGLWSKQTQTPSKNYLRRTIAQGQYRAAL